MKLAQRTAILITVAAAWLALVATAATASPPSVRGTAGAAKGCVTVTATIPVGIQPSGVATNPKTNTVYVANSFDNTVSLISGRTNTVTATIPVGREPLGVAANPKTNTAYVANTGSNTVSVLARCRR
jgi:YVTN family beta-propeller protein